MEDMKMLVTLIRSKYNTKITITETKMHMEMHMEIGKNSMRTTGSVYQTWDQSKTTKLVSLRDL
jgi:hypothetical protein